MWQALACAAGWYELKFYIDLFIIRFPFVAEFERATYYRDQAVRALLQNRRAGGVSPLIEVLERLPDVEHQRLSADMGFGHVASTS